MKLLIASDIHGSAHFCAQLMEAVEREQPEKLLLLGDLLYHGPRNPLPEGYDCPKTCAMLNSLKDRIAAVRGNCDCEVDQMVLEFPILAEYALVEWNGLTLFATHGHRYNGYCREHGNAASFAFFCHLQFTLIFAPSGLSLLARSRTVTT